MEKAGGGAWEGKRKKEGKRGESEKVSFTSKLLKNEPQNLWKKMRYNFKHSVHTVLTVFQGIIILITPHRSTAFLW